MMKKIQSVIFFIFLLMVLFLPVQQGECYATLQYKDVPLNIGTIKMPKDAIIKEFDILSIGEAFSGQKDRGLVELAKHANFYQIALSDGQNNYVAYLVTVVDSSISKEEINKIFHTPLGQKEAVLKLQKDLREDINRYIKETQEKRTVSEGIEKVTAENLRPEIYLTFFQWADVDFVTINEKNNYLSDIRIAGEFFGFFFALYGEAYVFEVEEKLGGLVLLTVDSERDFWQGILEKSMNDGIKN